MNLLVIADDESVGDRVPDCPADLLVCCGDVPDRVILAVAAKCGCREILAVKGHHDDRAPFRPPIRDLHLTTFPFRGVRFGGFCGAWKYQPEGNYLFEQREVEQYLRTFPTVDVFVAHNSPRLIHERDEEAHVGFVAFNTYITRAQPRLFLHGHQHRTEETVLGATRVLGTFGHRFLVLPD